MATRIAVINKGKLQQIDTPQVLYDRPDNLFVAGFIGSPAMNFFRGRLRKDGAKLLVEAQGFTIQIPKDKAKIYEGHAGKEIILGVRPENIHDPDFVPAGTHVEKIKARVDVTELMGNEIFLYLVTGKDSFVARVDPRSQFRTGNDVEIAFNMDNVHIFDAVTEEAIR